MMVFTIRENILPFRKQRVVIGTLIHAIHYFLSPVSYTHLDVYKRQCLVTLKQLPVVML